MKYSVLYVLSFFLSFPILGQQVNPREYAATISQQDLKKLLTIIASDSLEGRETGTRGQKMAAAFIAEEFKQLGLHPVVPTQTGPSFLQNFTLENYAENGIYLGSGDNRFSLGDDILFAGLNGMEHPLKNKIVFIPHEKTKNFAGIKIRDNIVLVAGINMTTNEQRELTANAYKHGANMVIIIPFKSREAFKKYKRSEGRNYARRHYAFAQMADKRMPRGYFLVSPQIGASLLGVTQEVMQNLLDSGLNADEINKLNARKRTISYFTSLPTKQITTENILGYLEGTDKKDELVVITAHYDHLGHRGEIIYNGADDDGSGTTSVLEIAEAFAKAKAGGHVPKRSILFMMFTGEEKGLIGSQYYTSHPIFPLATTVVDLNIDMVGRHDKAHDGNREFVYVVGSDRLSSDLHQLSEQTNATFTHLSLDYTYNDENHPDRIYYRSDHWNFAKHQVPIIFYFNGVHEDYHQPTDTVDKIEFDLLQKRAQLVFYTAWAIANKDQRLVVDKIKDVKP